MKTYLKFIQLVVFVGAMTLCFSFTNGPDKNITTENIKKVVGNDYIFMTNLSGSNEVPSVASDAKGKAIVRISKDETEIYYKIIVNNLDNPVAAHFHMAPAGSNGGVIVGLFSGMPEGRVNGMLTQGVITSENTDITMLIEAIRSGNIYVNVHTTTNPSGELRGQL